MKFSFGSGSLWGIANAANATPQEFGALQDVTLDFSFNLKELRGQYQFPLTVARGGGKITGKAKFGSIDAAVFNSLFFGQTTAVDASAVARQEQATIPPTAGNTVEVANSSPLGITDLGVVLTINGNRMVRAASTPDAGQYIVDETTGIYTFNELDAGNTVLIDYIYPVTASGIHIPINNQLMGTAPKFAVVLSEVYEGSTLVIRLNACVSNKLAMATKLEDFTIPELDFEAMVDASNSIGYISIK